MAEFDDAVPEAAPGGPAVIRTAMGTLRLDLAVSAVQKAAYPCYVSEGFRFA